ncbi:MAG TPA: hypothetical protein VGF62_01580 [Rhizomicrobium sp.]
MPLGSDVVVIASFAALTFSDKLAVAVCGVGVLASVTVIAIVAVPASLAPGVPLIAPVELPSKDHSASSPR